MLIEDDKKDIYSDKSQHIRELKAQVKQCTEELKRSRELLEREAQERKLTEQEKTAMLNSMAEHVIFHDKNMKIVWANRAAAKSVGMTTEELVGMNCYEIWQKRDTICEGCPVLKALETGTPHDNEMTTPDGRSWFLHGYPVKDDKGEVIGAVEVTMDLTVLKQAEQALKELERKIRTVFDSTNDAIIIYDLEGHILEVNKTSCDRLGYTRDEFLNMTAMNIASPVYAKLVLKRIEELKAKKQHFFETAHVTKDGKIIPVELSSRVIEFDGKPAILNVARDITQRKRTEAALRESERRYRSIVENSHAGILIVDDAYRFTYLNDELCRILKRSRDEIIGHDFREFLDDEGRELVGDRYVRRQRGEEVSPRYEFNVVQKTGKKKRVEISTTVIRDSAGKVITVAQILDITERKDTEQDLRRSREKYKTLTENLNVGIYRNTIGPTGKFIEANPAIVKMFGHETKDAFLSIDVVDLYQNPDDRRKFNDNMLAYGYVKDEILQLKRKDGFPFFASVSAVAVKDKQGNIQYYDGMIYDITERIQAEQELKLSYEKLKAVLNDTVNALASTIEQRDPYTFGHQQRVKKLAIANC